MLEKNVYLLYPAGYSGNYINWAINRSDCDLAAVTVANPLNTVNGRRLGGAGTAHHHQRLPTHMAIQDLLVWLAWNRPQKPQTFVVFTSENNLSTTIDCLCRVDPDPVFVVIHDDNNLDTRIYGYLNALLKWPTYFHMRQTLDNFQINTSGLGTGTDFDFFSAANDRSIRNAIAKNDISKWFSHLGPLDQTVISQCRNEIRRTKLWFDTRHSLQPHELPVGMHLVRDDLPYESIFQISCRDVAGPKFLEFFEDFMTRSGCSSDWSINDVSEFHHCYVLAQVNLGWFDAIEIWRRQESAQLTDFLTSNQCVEGFVIRELLHRVSYHSDPKIVLAGWEDQDLATINARYVEIQRSTWDK